MYFCEIDFRYHWVSLALNALRSGFTDIQKKADTEPWFDGLCQHEYAESILGIAFIIAQTYILGTVGDVNRIRKSSGKSQKGKIDYYSDVPKSLCNGVSQILLINSIADYHKHHDEWDGWGKGRSKPTTQILAGIGIVESTEFPCYVAATKLWDENEIENLGNLLTLIREWREYILSKYK